MVTNDSNDETDLDICLLNCFLGKLWNMLDWKDDGDDDTRDGDLDRNSSRIEFLTVLAHPLQSCGAKRPSTSCSPESIHSHPTCLAAVVLHCWHEPLLSLEASVAPVKIASNTWTGKG